MSSFEEATTVNVIFSEALPSVSQGLWCTSLVHIVIFLPSDGWGHLLVTVSCQEALKTTYQGCLCHLGTIQQGRLLLLIHEFGVRNSGASIDLYPSFQISHSLVNLPLLVFLWGTNLIQFTSEVSPLVYLNFYN